MNPRPSALLALAAGVNVGSFLIAHTVLRWANLAVAPILLWMAWRYRHK